MSSRRKNSFQETQMKRFVREVRSSHPTSFAVNLSGAAANRFREIVLDLVDSTLWGVLSTMRLGCEDILLQPLHEEVKPTRKRTKQTESLKSVSYYSRIRDCIDERVPRTSYSVDTVFDDKLVQPMDANVWIRLNIAMAVRQQFRV